MKFYPMDFLHDSAKLSPAAQSGWIRIICYAWNEPVRGIYKRTLTGMCYELGLDENEAIDLLKELEQVADVTVDNESVTVVSRRMRKEERARELNVNRQDRFRKKNESNGDVTDRNDSVTDKTLDVRRQTLDVREKKHPPIVPPGDSDSALKPKAKVKEKKLPVPYWQELIKHIDESWLKKKGAAYPWSPQEFVKLNQLARIYQVCGVMAMWDLYMSDASYWGKITRYMIDGLKKDVGVLVDDLRWKGLLRTHEQKLLATEPALKSTTAILSELGLKSAGNV